MDLLPPTSIVLFTIFFHLCLNKVPWKKHFRWKRYKEPNVCPIFLIFTLLYKFLYNVTARTNFNPTTAHLHCAQDKIRRIWESKQKINSPTWGDNTYFSLLLCPNRIECAWHMLPSFYEFIMQSKWQDSRSLSCSSLIMKQDDISERTARELRHSMCHTLF